MLVVVSHSAFAQKYPSHPVKLITGGVAGSLTDSLARPLAEKLSVTLGQPVIIDNRPGAGGILAMELVAKANPDGYTLGLATMSQLVFNSYLFTKLPYDPLTDLKPITRLVIGAPVIVAHPSLPANSLPELIALARTNPGGIPYAVPQLGSPPHLIGLLLFRAAGVDMIAVPFKSAMEGLSNVLAGEPQVLIDAPLIVAQYVKAGKLKALAVGGHERTPLLPDTPSFAELGMGDIPGDGWIGIVAPAGIPAAIATQLNEEIAQALRAPDLKDFYERNGWRIVGGSAEEFSAILREDHKVWGKIIRDSGLKVQ